MTSGGLTLAARLAYEKHRSVERNGRRSWPFRERHRANPEIPGGTLGSAAVSVKWTAPEISSALRHIEAEIEHAPGLVSGLNFDFTLYRMEAEIRLPTLFRRRPVPASFDFKVIAGASSRRLPPQRYFALDGSLAMLDAVHVRRFETLLSLHGRTIEGERRLGVFWKHDFTTWPFEWGILWPLAQRGMSVALFGGHGRTWIAESTLSGLSLAPAYENRFIHEIGFSLSSVGGTLLRIDIAARLDRPGLTFGIGAKLDGR